MMRINQLAKELGVPNHDILDVAEKRLGLTGKSHSSNLTDDQAAQIRRVVEGKGKGEETAPLGLHKPAAAVKVVKGPKLEKAAPAADPAPAPEAPAKPAPSVLVKKAEPKPEAPAPAPEAPQAAAPAPQVEAKAETAPAAPAPVPAPAPRAEEGFSRLKISATPAPAPKAEEKPARYIQLPQTPAKREGGPKPEAGARPMLQRPGQPSHVQRSGERPQEKAVLPMASNTSRGEVKHEPVPPPPGKRPYIPPSIQQMRSEGGFSKISISDTPAPAPRPQEPARYIQLPQPRPAG
ncbi:MAG TPA: translation initiation factor IF-2 N-terminal domain-containing protein, partial [Geothrix sp.]|nr:translation initiation factor IF-2 N-terminal domain-containing protein [Geothrix sp.]